MSSYIMALFLMSLWVLSDFKDDYIVICAWMMIAAGDIRKEIRS